MARPTPAKSSAQKPTALPPVEDGELATIVELSMDTRHTRPPERYDEGRLVEDMKAAGKFVADPQLKATLKDVSGIGTPATRDSIIEKLKKDGLLARQSKWIVPTEKGRALIAYLPPGLYDIATTATWEAKLEAVAQSGGHARFVREVADLVATHVNELRAMGAMSAISTVATQGSTTSHGEPMQQESGGARRQAPTPKMLEFARSIAQRASKRLTKEIEEDFDKCREFIDSNKDAASRPSDKQLKFAELIAERKGTAIPEDVKANGKKLSAWIDENR